MTAFGEVGGDRPTLRFERRYEAGSMEVWAALTERDLLARWMFPASFEPRAGGALRFEYGEHTSPGTVLVWEEPRVLEYEWADAPDQSRWHVRFALRANGDGTMLEFTHLLPDPGNPEYAAGWHWHLDRLEAMLRGEEPARVDSDDHFEELLRHYQDR